MQRHVNIRVVQAQTSSAGEYNIGMLIENPLATLGLQTNLVAKACANGT